MTTYLRLTKSVDVTIEKEFSDEKDVTKIIVNLDLKVLKSGVSLELLNELITSITNQEGIKTYKIHHDPNGLVIVGNP